MNVCVVGAGIMGHGIAQVAATNGYSAALVDISDDFVQEGMKNIEKSLGRVVKSGKITEDQSREILGRIKSTTSLEEAAGDADVVIEAITENIQIKQDLFKRLEQICRTDTIFASNTSQFSITELASVLDHPERFIGMHWFNPPVIMKLVEIARGFNTSDHTFKTLKKLSEDLGKEVVVCKDSQGFITSRLIAVFALEAMRIYEEGIATIEDIDKACKLAFNHPMGPFTLNDFSGLDTGLYVYDAMRQIFGERFLAPQELRNRVRAGCYGRKSGKGWYDYSE